MKNRIILYNIIIIFVINTEYIWFAGMPLFNLQTILTQHPHEAIVSGGCEIIAPLPRKRPESYQ